MDRAREVGTTVELPMTAAARASWRGFRRRYLLWEGAQILFILGGLSIVGPVGMSLQGASFDSTRTLLVGTCFLFLLVYVADMLWLYLRTPRAYRRAGLSWHARRTRTLGGDVTIGRVRLPDGEYSVGHLWQRELAGLLGLPRGTIEYIPCKHGLFRPTEIHVLELRADDGRLVYRDPAYEPEE